MSRVWKGVLGGLGLAVLGVLSGCQKSKPAPDPGLSIADLLKQSVPHTNLSKLGPDLLEKQSKQLAGPHAVDCGKVLVGGDPKAATACALAAQRAGKPFRVRYDLQGIDSFVAVAIVRSSIGVVSALLYDSDIAGGGGRRFEVVHPMECPTPVHLWVNPTGRINCFQKESSPPRDAMSPNAEPY
jgi:hypothetical protein